MVTATHEASHRLFQEHPEALAPVFEALGLPPPAKTDFHELSPDTTEIRPMERRADTVLMFEPDMGEHFVLAVEAQTKKDPEKARNWAYYVSYLRAKYDLPVLLVAVCRDPSTAAWAMGPFECSVGPWTTQVTRPFVLGPQTVPEVTDEAVVAQQPPSPPSRPSSTARASGPRPYWKRSPADSCPSSRTSRGTGSKSWKSGWSPLRPRQVGGS